MINTIIWNIKGVRSQKAIHRLKNLCIINKIDFAAIIEPFSNKGKIQGYMRFLRFHHCQENINGQIWYFWKQNCQAKVIANEEQQITLQIKHDMIDNELCFSVVYAKCTTKRGKTYGVVWKMYIIWLMVHGVLKGILISS